MNGWMDGGEREGENEVLDNSDSDISLERATGQLLSTSLVTKGQEWTSLNTLRCGITSELIYTQSEWILTFIPSSIKLHKCHTLWVRYSFSNTWFKWRVTCEQICVHSPCASETQIPLIQVHSAWSPGCPHSLDSPGELLTTWGPSACSRNPYLMTCCRNNFKLNSWQCGLYKR